MKKTILLLFLSPYICAMQREIPKPSTTVDITNHDVVMPLKTPSPLDGSKGSQEYHRHTSHRSLNVKDLESMDLTELKTWVIGTIAQYETQHATSLQQLSDTLAQHAQTVTAVQNTAQSAQNSSKYAVIAAAVTGGCAIIVCIASSLLSHYL